MWECILSLFLKKLMFCSSFDKNWWYDDDDDDDEMQKIKLISNFFIFILTFFFKPRVTESADWDPADKEELLYKYNKMGIWNKELTDISSAMARPVFGWGSVLKLMQAQWRCICLDQQLK